MKKIFLIFVSIVAVLGCSSGESEQEIFKIEKITPSDTIFTYDSLTPIGFKKTKTYKVKDLPEANSAYFGFLKETKAEYEVRFYNSHQDAVDYGTSLAEERTGENAIVKTEDATWKEGIKEARSCGGSKNMNHSATCMIPKFGDYIIFGNMILLCEGYDPEVSMLNCSNIIEKLLKEK